VEMDRTFTDHPKPLYFDEDKERYKRFLPKIEHVVVRDYPDDRDDAWRMENHQRDAISRGLDGIRPDDVVIVSDADEIVSADAVRRNVDRPGVKFFRMRMFYYFFNCEGVGQVWDKAKMARYRDLDGPQWLRDWPAPSRFERRRPVRQLLKHLRRVHGTLTGRHVTVRNGGWHFSYLGGVDAIRYKVRSFAHTQFAEEDFLDPQRVLRLMERGEDLFGRRGMRFRFVSLDGDFPDYLLRNRRRFLPMIREAPTAP
jgi:beta-1,4-mannosyl-glycoprotein beta-1,4-N-acetylglucosaminyltransferase